MQNIGGEKLKEIIKVIKQNFTSQKDVNEILEQISDLTKERLHLKNFTVYIRQGDYLISNDQKIDLLNKEDELTAALNKLKEFTKLDNKIYLPIVEGNQLIGAIAAEKSTRFTKTNIKDLETIATLIGLVISQSTLSNNITKKYKDLELLYKISSELVKSIRLGELLEKTVNLVKETFGYDSVAILLLDDEEHLRVKSRTNSFNKHIERIKISIKKGEGITGLSGKLKKVIISNDVKNDKRYINGNKQTNSEIAIPLLYNGKLLGVLDIESNEKNAFSEEDAKILQSVAGLLSGAIENALLYKKMEELAEKDELTGLYNYRVFRKELSKEVSRSKRYGKIFSLAMFDIDFFKEYNDNNGHDVGNTALKKVGAILRKESRFTDLPARFGGEEFITILPETNKDGAFTYAERVRKKIEETKFPGEEKQPNGKLTISGGVAEFPIDGNTPEQILKAVDIAAYKAKNSGRNRIVKYNEELGGEQ